MLAKDNVTELSVMTDGFCPVSAPRMESKPSELIKKQQSLRDSTLSITEALDKVESRWYSILSPVGFDSWRQKQHFKSVVTHGLSAFMNDLSVHLLDSFVSPMR